MERQIYEHSHMFSLKELKESKHLYGFLLEMYLSLASRYVSRNLRTVEMLVFCKFEGCIHVDLS